LELKKPILAFVTPGAQLEFLENSGLALIFNPDNIEENSKKLNEVLTSQFVFETNKFYLDNYNRRNLTRRLSELISC
jgi:hypothetical protein